MTFKKKFRGYDPQQVDAYLRDKNDKESRIRNAQKERIDMLADENYVLRQELKQYHADERAIAQSLVEAQQLADEVKGNAEEYSKVVLNRAKTFYATWRAYSQTLVASLTREEVQAFNALQRKIEDLINAYEGKNVAEEMADVESRKEDLERKAAAKKESSAKKDVAKDVPLKIVPPTAEDDDEEDEPVLELDLSLFETDDDDADDDTVADETQDETVDVVDLTVEDEMPEAESAEDELPQDLIKDTAENAASTQVMTNPISKVEQASEHAIDLMELLKPEQSLEDICADLGLIGPSKTKKR